VQEDETIDGRTVLLTVERRLRSRFAAVRKNRKIFPRAKMNAAAI